MINRGCHLVFRIDNDSVSYFTFAIFSLNNDLKEIEEKIVKLAESESKILFHEYFLERRIFGDKFLLWFAFPEKTLGEIALRASRLAGTYCYHNGCLYLSISQVLRRYTDLYWHIVNKIPESENDCLDPFEKIENELNDEGPVDEYLKFDQEVDGDEQVGFDVADLAKSTYGFRIYIYRSECMSQLLEDEENEDWCPKDGE